MGSASVKIEMKIHGAQIGLRAHGDGLNALTRPSFRTFAERVACRGRVRSTLPLFNSTFGGEAADMTDILDEIGDEIRSVELQLLRELRSVRRQARRLGGCEPPGGLTLGQKVADGVAATMGSWRFIIIQSILLTAWITLNVTAFIQKWDPYPFILLNLALSFQAAYAAPFIMMSQNRQQEIDRRAAETDHQVNIKAEMEIELLHQKVDALREEEVLALTTAIKDLTDLLKTAQGGHASTGTAPASPVVPRARKSAPTKKVGAPAARKRSSPPQADDA